MTKILLRLIYYMAPVLAFASVLIPIFTHHSILWGLLFFPLGFIGMFAGGAADALGRKSDQ